MIFLYFSFAFLVEKYLHEKLKLCIVYQNLAASVKYPMLVRGDLWRHIEGKLDFRRRNRFKRANTGDTNFRLTGIVHNLVK